MTKLSQVIGLYTKNMNFSDLEGVYSPLGTWMLLAACSLIAEADERQELEKHMCCSTEDASLLLKYLLQADSKVMTSLLALWFPGAFVDPIKLSTWQALLPSDTELSDKLPADLDQWAKDKTHGLIEKFPLDLDEETQLVLTSVLTMRGRWRDPYSQTGALKALGNSNWGVNSVLTGSGSNKLYQTQAAGLVAVHTNETDNGAVVISAIAADGIDQTKVFAAMHEIQDLEPIDLFDLNILPDEDYLSISEDIVTSSRSSEYSSYIVYLPAWDIETEHDLLKQPAVALAAGIVGRYFGFDKMPNYSEAAAQAARAKYNRTGFEAAAISSMAWMVGSAFPDNQVRRRRAILKFCRPFALMAYDVIEEAMVPVFVTWVDKAVEPEEIEYED